MALADALLADVISALLALSVVIGVRTFDAWRCQAAASRCCRFHLMPDAGLGLIDLCRGLAALDLPSASDCVLCPCIGAAASRRRQR